MPSVPALTDPTGLVPSVLAESLDPVVPEKEAAPTGSSALDALVTLGLCCPGEHSGEAPARDCFHQTRPAPKPVRAHAPAERTCDQPRDHRPGPGQ